ncbi:UNVERIFIED_ORG: hypothetical protein J2W38_006323 [Variovorax paradoxus]|nr:hypothetical protein [Variovorax paradoxus]
MNPMRARFTTLFLVGLVTAGLSHAEGAANELFPHMSNIENAQRDSKGLGPQQEIVVAPFLGDLSIALTFVGRDGQPVAATHADLERLSLNHDMARQLALKNFKTRCVSKFTSFEGNFWAIDVPYAPECQSAVYLLWDEIWLDVGRKLTNGVVAAMPTEGMLMFASADDSAAVGRLERLISSEQAMPMARPMSSLMYIHRDGRWAVLSVNRGK